MICPRCNIETNKNRSHWGDDNCRDALLNRVAELEAGLRPFADTYDTYQRVIKEPGYGPLFSLDGATYEFQRAWELLNGTQQGSESSESEGVQGE